MITDTIGQPSPDAAPVAIPGWCSNPRSTPPIHRRADSCTLVECPELVLPAGLVAEIRQSALQDAAAGLLELPAVSGHPAAFAVLGQVGRYLREGK